MNTTTKTKGRTTHLIITAIILFMLLLGSSLPAQAAPNQATIPGGATITSATFSIYVTSFNNQTVHLHRINAAWTESGVTWNNFGSSYDSPILGSFLANNTGWYSVDVTSLVQGWVDGTYPNYGLLLEQGVTNPTTYNSSEYTVDKTQRPKLEICYSTPFVSNTCITIQRPDATQNDVADAYIWALEPDTNFGSSDILYTGQINGQEKDSLFKFTFNVTPPASVGDFVWNDSNGNGVQDSGETGLSGVKVDLYTSSGTPVATTTSDSTGIYSFTNLPAGDYYLIFEKPDTYNFTPAKQGSDPALDSDPNPITGQTTTFTLSPGENNDTLDAGLAQMDFGDLPASYANTLLANDGPRHVIGNLRLGKCISPDSDGQESPTATGDTCDDGVLLDPTSVWQPGNTVNLTVTVTGGSGYLAGWFDWNNNNAFDAGEMSVGQAVSTGEKTISLVVPNDYTTGQNLFARFRLYETEPITPSTTGMVVNGEDEDYMFSFRPTAIQLSSFSAKPTASSSGVISLALLGFVSLTGAAWILRKRHA